MEGEMDHEWNVFIILLLFCSSEFPSQTIGFLETNKILKSLLTVKVRGNSSSSFSGFSLFCSSLSFLLYIITFSVFNKMITFKLKFLFLQHFFFFTFRIRFIQFDPVERHPFKWREAWKLVLNGIFSAIEIIF